MAVSCWYEVPKKSPKKIKVSEGSRRWWWEEEEGRPENIVETVGLYICWGNNDRNK
jgi:hypothetical protein